MLIIPEGALSAYPPFILLSTVGFAGKAYLRPVSGILAGTKQIDYEQRFAKRSVCEPDAVPIEESKSHFRIPQDKQRDKTYTAFWHWPNRTGFPP